MHELSDDRLAAAGVRLWLVHDSNKPRKLKYNLIAAREQGHHTLLTFGGAYSNHLRAVADAGREHGFQTIGIVRGEQTLPLNESLAHCVAQGMRLSYLDRSSYRRWRLHIGDLRRRFGEFFLIPEGGSNALAALGCSEIASGIDARYDLICCPVGTGGTLAGLAAGLPSGTAALGFSVLKGGDFLAEEVAQLQREAFGRVSPNWQIELGFHCGGYARRNAELDDFLADFHARHGIELDWVYVGKMMLGIFALAARGRLPSRVVALITT
ncbi:1-aminocyclopropane-1-carboxylate deaminase/D-cysteine desulfhydrase [Allorhizocola rhizosphaerae]|uniref:1-aminocyclopropane-1-carboxylate deaminase/D-cysteine desulfhydrase n=1 Tax=Allorhizocola rhizosphaerae TaxID=1872709 RepID=UPI000E3BB691|nr:pyridoxal-phosphate dependent enzyme [Allorhizocola rhizosphaerae]